MYSTNWFESFAPLPENVTSLEVTAISRLCPRPQFERLLEIGCGTGRVSGPLSTVGYDVTALDISADALAIAARRAAGPKYVALDQRHVGRMAWTFDTAIVLWNSIGFGTRADDEQTLRGVAGALRPGGKFLIDLYHPEWLADQATVEVKSEGTNVRRWVKDGRCFHIIRYDNGWTDDIQFNVYMPGEISEMLERVGLRVTSRMTWWTSERAPTRACARYQLECVRA